MASEAQIRASTAYNRRHDSITIRPDKDIGAQIRQAANQAGQSIQVYILQAVHERIQREEQHEQL